MAVKSPSRDTIVCAAVEIASAEERAAYIAEVCGGNPDLRQQVEKLVDAHFRSGGFLECNDIDALASSSTVTSVFVSP